MDRPAIAAAIVDIDEPEPAYTPRRARLGFDGHEAKQVLTWEPTTPKRLKTPVAASCHTRPSRRVKQSPPANVGAALRLLSHPPREGNKKTRHAPGGVT